MFEWNKYTMNYVYYELVMLSIACKYKINSEILEVFRSGFKNVQNLFSNHNKDVSTVLIYV